MSNVTLKGKKLAKIIVTDTTKSSICIIFPIAESGAIKYIKGQIISDAMIKLSTIIFILNLTYAPYDVFFKFPDMGLDMVQV